MSTLSLTFVPAEWRGVEDERFSGLFDDVAGIEEVTVDGDACTVRFESHDGGEEAAVWEVMCRIAAAFPGAVIST